MMPLSRRLGYSSAMREIMPTEDVPKSASGTQLLDKALDMIDLVEQSGQRLTASAIAQTSGYPKPTVNRILSALVRRGFLALDRRDQSYELGMRFTQLAAALRRSHRLVTLVEEQLISLSSRTGETVSLGVPEPTAVRIVGRYHMGLESVPGGPTGAKRPYHASAVGKALLSGMPEKHALRHIARSNLDRFTGNTFVARAPLLADLQLTRARGYALDDEEIVAGVRCAAVPVFSADGTVVAAVSLSAPAHRMTAERMAEIVAALNVIAGKASDGLQTPAADVFSTDGITCLRTGGLFHPTALAASADQILVVDAAAPAIYSFLNDGSLSDKRPLPVVPDAAAAGPDGTVLLARGHIVEHLARDGAGHTVTLAAPVTALATGPDGRGYALTSDGAVHDALSGRRLFETAEKATAMTVAGKMLCLLAADASHVALHDPGGRRTGRIALHEMQPDAMTGIAGCIWIAGHGRIDRIEIATGTREQIAAPEPGITAMAVQDGDLLMAGANLNAALSDFDSASRHCGSLYRIADAVPGG